MTTQVANGEDISLLVQRLAMESGTDRRGDCRFIGSLAVELQQLDDDTLQPAGPVQRAIARDISRSGIAIMHDEPVRSKFLAVGVLAPGDEEATDLILEVSRCRPVGDFFDIAGTFLYR